LGGTVWPLGGCWCAQQTFAIFSMRNPSFSALAAAPPNSPPAAFLLDVLSGLAATQKAIPPRWFYDEEGSRLFEDITRLPEYYPTRCEHAILAANMESIAPLLGRNKVLVEFGAGSATKTSALLRHAALSEYIAIDISGEFLRQSVHALQTQFPHIPMQPLEADFLHPLELPAVVRQRGAVGFFPGSTLGNLSEAAAVDLLRGFGHALGPDAALLLGVDLLKNDSILLPAYDDSQGVTAAFNLNLLHRINRELSGSVPVSAFEHEVRWNERFSRIEMHLRARRDMRFRVAGRCFSMEKGETIHTENSYKYTARDIRLLLRAGGWNVTGWWTDQDGYFAVMAAERISFSAAQEYSAG
jgi:dimethylhistidine N-methyltransferase